MKQFFNDFVRSEDGAVTVDWVVLTAAVVGLSVTAYTNIRSGTDGITGNTDTTLAGFSVGDVSLPE